MFFDITGFGSSSSLFVRIFALSAEESEGDGRKTFRSELSILIANKIEPKPKVKRRNKDKCTKDMKYSELSKVL